jgi:hypothetical protein
MGVPSPAVLAPLGCGYARFHAGANFALTEFYEVRELGSLGSLSHKTGANATSPGDLRYPGGTISFIHRAA